MPLSVQSLANKVKSLAVTTRSNIPQQPLKVTTAPNYTGTLKVGSGSTAKYKSGTTTVQGSSYRPQATAPASTVQKTAPSGFVQSTAPGSAIQGADPIPYVPPKKQRTTKLTVYDKNTNKFNVIDKVDFLTDAQWKDAQEVSKRMQRFYDMFEEKRKGYVHEYKYKADLYSEYEDAMNRIQAQSEIEYKMFEKRIGELQQAVNDSKTEEEWNRNYKAFMDYGTRQESYFQNMAYEAQAYERAVMQELDKTGLSGLKSRSIWEHAKGVASKIFDYSLGEKGVLDLKRVANTGINYFNQNRDVYKHGGEWGGEGKVSDEKFGTNALQKAWNASQQQRWRQGQDLNDYMGYNSKDKAILNVLDFMAENFTDPNIFIPAGTYSKAVKSGSKAVGLTKLATKTKSYLKPFTEALEGNKLGKAFKWLFSEHDNFSSRLSKANKPFYKKISENVTKSKIGSRIWSDSKSKVTNQVRRTLSKLDDDQLYYLQKMLDKKGTVDDVISGFSKKGIKGFDNVVDSYKTWRQTFDDMISQEYVSGVSFERGYRGGYLPYKDFSVAGKIKRATGFNNPKSFVNKLTQKIKHPLTKVDDVADEGYFNRTAGFTKSRNSKFNKGKVYNRKQLEDVFSGRINTGKFVSRADDGLRLMDEASGAITDASNKIARNKQLIKKTPWEKVTAPVSRAGDVWRQSVLKYRPAWYVNNEVFNQIAGTTAGGFGFLKNQKGYKNYLTKLADELGDDAVEEVVGGFSKYVGGSADDLAKIGSRKGLSRFLDLATDQETRARTALYKWARDKGASHADAIKETNKWLFNYNYKNIERPLRTVAPFYKFNAGVTRTVGALPWRSPRASTVFRTINRELYEKPLNNLPEGDPNGFNPRDAYKGKAGFGDTFVSTPFYPFQREGVGEFSKNPILSGIDELATNRDKYGNRLDGQSWWRSFSQAFPQLDLALVTKDALQNPTSTKKWLANGSALPKEKTTDNTAIVAKKVRSFIGIPSKTTFNREKFEETKRFLEFNKEFWNQDWDNMEFEQKNKLQNEIANKYGFDLQKDIYNGWFAQNDTLFTSGVKARKSQGFKTTQDFWTGYWEQPEGERSKYVQEKRLDYERDQEFINNPYANIIKDWMARGVEDRGTASTVDDIDLTDPNKYLDWISFWNAYTDASKDQRKAMLDANPQYKKALSSSGGSAVSAFWTKYFSFDDYSQRANFYEQNYKPEYGGTSKKSDVSKFWTDYFAITDVDARRAFYEQNYKPEYGGQSKFTPEQVAERNFWLEYYSVNPDKKRRLKLANPQYFNDQIDPVTSQDYEAIRDIRRNKRKLAFSNSPGFQNLYSGFKDKIAVDTTKAPIKGFSGVKYN